MEAIQKNPMVIMEQLNKLVSENSEETMEFIDDLKEFRLFNEMIKNKDVKKLYDSLTSNFYMSNGLFNRIDLKALNDEQKTFISLITLQDYTPTNRFRQHILKYYYDNINEPIEKLNIKNASKSSKTFAKNYYSGVPGISAELEKIKIEKPNIKELKHLEQFIPLFIKIGESMQFDVQGFQKNQLLYLLFGICICSTLNKLPEFKGFKELINYIISIIQINLLNKVFLSEDVEGCKASSAEGASDETWGLVTFLDFKEDDKIKHNYRYQCAKKYINEVGGVSNARNCFTKLTDDEKGTYLSTTYKTKDLKTLWDKFEELYAAKKFEELINLWFDSQILTRSTCLVGCMLISILNGKLIKFKHNEMPDWKSIIEGNFKDTYEEIEDLRMLLHPAQQKIIPETIENSLKDLKCCDILNCLRCYISSIA